jgi:hypothetical protein
MASSRPAAVDSAAARPPAATSAITQFGKLRDLRVGQHHDVTVEP